MFFSIALLLRHLNFSDAADRIDNAVVQTVNSGRDLTYDLGGCASTTEMAAAIIRAMQSPSRLKRASILCVNNKLLDGEGINGGAAEIGRRLSAAGYAMTSVLSCAGQLTSVQASLEHCLGGSDLVVVSGGLDAKSDGVTRAGVAATLGLPLCFDSASMEHIDRWISKEGLSAHPDASRQARIPEGASPLLNDCSLSPGFWLDWQDRRLLALPEALNECLPMLDFALSLAPAIR